MNERVFKLYDTQTREVKELRPIEPGQLTFYSCGPTVYSYAHIGNFRTFLTADLVVRTAEAIGWKVNYVSNITDVGHMTQDDVADAGGEDKMERALKSKDGEQFANVWELAEHYANAFTGDWKSLNLREPMTRPKATQHMREQILAVEDLIAKNHAYETPTGVYFDVSSFADYGKLSGNKDQEQLFRGVRNVVQDDNKKHPSDFALWKKDDKHLMQWFSPWGWGFPGWHIECSVMARQYLGDTIDLHAGGEDLIFPHHECEIAQSEALTGKPFANHWMHTRFLQVNGEKMAKSAGNYYTVRDLVVERGIDPLALRYALISGVYSKPFNFTDQGLKDATANIERFKKADLAVTEALQNGSTVNGQHSTIGGQLETLYEEMLEAMLNDLNTAVALAKALEGARLITKEPLNDSAAKSAREFLDKTNALLGIVRPEYPTCSLKKEETGIGEKEIENLIQKRQEAKQSKDFQLADAIRKQLEDEGIELRDTPAGAEWLRKPKL